MTSFLQAVPGDSTQVIATFDPNLLWIGWEARPRRLSDESARAEAEALLAELGALRWTAACRQPRFWRAPLVELLLEKSADALPEKPDEARIHAGKAERLAVELLEIPGNGARVAVYLGRAKYLQAVCGRLTGHSRDLEKDFLETVQFLSRSRTSLDRAFFCRSLALLRWEQGRLDEAEGLLERAADLFSIEKQREEWATTQALLGLYGFEQGGRVRTFLALSEALAAMDLERRPWLTVRVAFALALSMALAVLQEAWRLGPHLTQPWERMIARWWEGRFAARCGNYPEAVGLLRSTQTKLCEWRRVPEAALVTLDCMLALVEAGRGAEVGKLVERFESWLGGDQGGDLALLAVRAFRGDIVTAPDRLRGLVEARAAYILRQLRLQGRRIDPLPFA